MRGSRKGQVLKRGAESVGGVTDAAALLEEDDMAWLIQKKKLAFIPLSRTNTQAAGQLGPPLHDLVATKLVYSRPSK